MMRPRVIQILKLSPRIIGKSSSLQCEGIEHVLKNFTVSKFKFLRCCVASLAHLWTVYVYCICDVQYNSKVKYHNTIEYFKQFATGEDYVLHSVKANLN